MYYTYMHLCEDETITYYAFPSTFLLHVGCERIECSPDTQCVSDPTTGSGVCVGLCEESVSHCLSDQICRIQQYNFTFCDPSPCQYPVCSNAPYGKYTYSIYV